MFLLKQKKAIRFEYAYVILPKFVNNILKDKPNEKILLDEQEKR